MTDTTEKEARDWQTLVRLAQHLASEVLDTACPCHLTSDDGRTRCRGRQAVVRWEDNFADNVCRTHAARAQERGALVVFPRPHDSTPG